jgi:hypothetical protein
MIILSQLFQKQDAANIEGEDNWLKEITPIAPVSVPKQENEDEFWTKLEDGELLIDVYQRPDALVIRSLMAHVSLLVK